MRPLLLALCALLAMPAVATAEHFDHGAWDALLKRHVVLVNKARASEVDYRGMAADRPALSAYLAALAEVSREDFDRWPRDAQLAFLINAYNAWTVELILSAWPDIQSIKELGSIFRSPWSREFASLLGETRSLDSIEHRLIRGSERYRDPRIHFAVNCASIGCPALRAEAYSEHKLNAQLAEQTERFLADDTRNRLANGRLELSPIFKWYREDFEKGWLNYHSLDAFLADYAEALALTPASLAKLRAGTLDIHFLDYDWRLNAKQ